MNELTRLNHINTVKTSFLKHVVDSDEMCNRYTGFICISMLKVVLDFLNPGPTGENNILYHNRLVTATGDLIVSYINHRFFHNFPLLWGTYHVNGCDVHAFPSEISLNFATIRAKQYERVPVAPGSHSQYAKLHRCILFRYRHSDWHIFPF